MRYRPYMQSGTVGFECEAEDGSITYVYLNPSDTDCEEDADIFVYAGDTGDPAEDSPVVYVVPVNVKEK